VKLSVIALDYDGTTARDDVMGPQVREAIAAARAAGIVVVLVTGRILSELQRVAGDLRVATIQVADGTLSVRQQGDLGGCEYDVAPVDVNTCMPAGPSRQWSRPRRAARGRRRPIHRGSSCGRSHQALVQGR